MLSRRRIDEKLERPPASLKAWHESIEAHPWHEHYAVLAAILRVSTADAFDRRARGLGKHLRGLRGFVQAGKQAPGVRDGALRSSQRDAELLYSLQRLDQAVRRNPLFQEGGHPEAVELGWKIRDLEEFASF